MDTVVSLVGGRGIVEQTGSSWVDVVAMGVICSGGGRTRKEVLGPCRLSLGDCVTLPPVPLFPQSLTLGVTMRGSGELPPFL